ncbi:CHAP domain-containing protein [Mariprofundus erugo]|uniref:CHAP domain-containing protein n=1 Tax=Mariprofundus erugo TaxID=2528639 RepID=A0A5R9GUY3_9PROT|nr:glutathionylspermidine synthase family protein [Mariprofundus erugo]TLS66994.1 CHAP domain-containing protein [Mariprofundus erugo]
MQENAKFNTILGYAPGHVPVYSSHYPSADEAEFASRRDFRSYIDGVFMGYKWQCVEFARRWLYLNHGCTFDNIPMAYDIFHLRSLRSLKDHMLLPLRSFRNGARRPPEPGCMLIWEEGGEFEETGHVAIVTEVFADRVRIVEQNVSHQVWAEGQQYSRELRARTEADGSYHIECTYPDAAVLGWVIQTDDDTYAEIFYDIPAGLLNLQGGCADAAPLVPAKPSAELKPEERAYIACMGDYTLTHHAADKERYIRMSEAAMKELRHASNEMHAMFMQATDHVLENDALLERFGFPRVLWPRLRSSWDNRRNHMITGRLDFALCGRGIKIYEYNADSASCYMECGQVQGQWSAMHGVEEGWDPGSHLHEALVHAWKKSGMGGVLHIMQDNDLEETYHALYMKSAMEEAGIACKVIRGLADLAWNDAGEVVDRDGMRIRHVWKTWAWETALDQLRAECDEEQQQPQLPGVSARLKYARPRLVDVLLRREVQVFEPLWTLVPSNKAILPVLWELFTDHPRLLDAQFSLTGDLRRKGYVAKPVVGRCGANISMVARGDQLIGETSGQFDDREQIYQEFFELPQVNDHYVQVSGFIVDGRFAGACIRADRSPIITGGSDLFALRIVPDADLQAGQAMSGSLNRAG